MTPVLSIGPTLVACVLAAFVVSFASVRATIAYAHRRGMLDEPGRRRSHIIPTPRGGGIGIVLGALAGMPAGLLLLPVSPGAATVGAFSVATIAIAGIGWLDDHGSLPIKPRLLIQLAATLLLCVAVASSTASLWWALPLLLAGVWCVNLHNFMDGIDGLAAQQAVFFGAASAALAWSAGSPAMAGAGLAMAAASLGFWCFNRSPARIFMGDVGSATLGLMVFALSAMLWAWRTNLLWPALIFSSAFVIDATLTLLVRMLRGARWYTPHREHLYQWLVRRGSSHRRVALCYLAWNVLVCVPVAWIAFRYPAVAPVCFGATYVLGAAVWRTGKRYGLRRRERHVSA
ncbi:MULTISPECIES: glycosyltransferase family 4 protein [Rhodanobacteraceae]|uniref:MraY family glycosyltransferase n=1 Tax=Rhodanobacteraceae TaxID=1775411 RepID=UPI0008883AF0|nr:MULTISPECIES: glycosyltransferase family 4 protein [Rhodanobacteraceae]SDF66299.1 Fuc2NAc and GlcNAc transferase [Dyella sp. 333MFSha]SKB62610.1 Fuc2NAc and GlcNAc transferase [Luteibacter sp. 22Crub2.1]